MKQVRGFTLTEMIIAVGIMSILMMIAIPNFQDQVRRNAAGKVQEDMYADLIFARSEAIARARSITICPVADATAATLDCSGDVGDWNNGWIVITDTDRSSSLTAASGSIPADEVLRVFINANSDMVDIQPNGSAAIRYNGRGLLEAGNQSFLFCDSSSGFKEALVVASGTGRVRYTDGAGLTCS